MKSWIITHRNKNIHVNNHIANNAEILKSFPDFSIYIYANSDPNIFKRLVMLKIYHYSLNIVITDLPIYRLPAKCSCADTAEYDFSNLITTTP